VAQAFNSVLFQRYPAETNRNDAPINGVFIYLICFRLSELPFEEFRKFVYSQNPVKMNVMFQLLFNVELLNEHVRDEWCKIYDATYIDETIIGGIQKNLPLVADLLVNISLKATGKVSDFVSTLGTNVTDRETKGKGWKPTVPEPFPLSQAKVKALPQPVMIPKIVKANPVPKTTYQNGLKEIEEEKVKKNKTVKEVTVKKYTEAKAQRFEFETEKRPTNIEKLKEEEETKMKKTTALKTHYKPMPVFDHSDTDIKFNAATILKEEAIIKKARQEQEDYVKQVEMNMRDSQEFEEWKKKELDKEEVARLELQEKRRVEMQLAREAAMKAAEEVNKKNKENALQMKEISKEHKKEFEEKVAEEVGHKKKLKTAIVEARVNIEIEKNRMNKEKKKIHDDIKKDKKERWFMKVEEDEIQKKKRDELIKKIRELESKPIDRTKHFDPKETAGHGILQEMTLVELRQRIDQLKQEKLEEMERRRLENIKKKEEKELELRAKAEEIKALRAQSAVGHKERKVQKLKLIEDEKKRQQEIREKSLLVVHEKIQVKKEDKKVELQRIAKELREIKLKRQYMNADKALLEAKAWQSLEEGAEREIKYRQNVKLFEQEGVETIKLKERKILAARAVTQVEEKLEALREYDRAVEVATKQNEALFREEREAKIRNHDEIRKYEHAHLENMQTRDPFKTKISTMNLTRAKSSLSASRMTNTSVAGAREEIILPPSKYADKENRGAIIVEKPERLES